MKHSADNREPPGRKEVFLHTLSQLLDNSAKALTDLQGAEDNTRQVYSDRLVFELLQNARDAAVRDGTDSPRVRIEITEHAFLVANEGEPFTREGYESITGIGKSAKNGAGAAGEKRLIGRKGIGFKSVLRVSRRPQIFGRTGDGNRYAIEFGSPRIRDFCRCTADGDEDGLVGMMDEDEVSLYHRQREEQPLRRCSLCRSIGQRGVGVDDLLGGLPVMMFPLWVRNIPPRVGNLLGWTASESDRRPFDTVIRLPLDREQVKEVQKLVHRDVNPEKLLFLGTLAEIEVKDSADGGADRLLRAEWGESEGTVTIWDPAPGRSAEAASEYRIFSRDRRIPIGDGESEVRNVKAAVPVDGGKVRADRRYPLFNYYPIDDEGRVLPILLHGEFEVDPGRTKFSADHRELNQILIDQMVELLCGSAPDTMLEAFIRGDVGARHCMPQMLVPAPTDRDLPGRFRRKLLNKLRERQCVPVDGGWTRSRRTIHHPDEAGRLERAFGGEFERIGRHLPVAETREKDGFSRALEELGGVTFGSEHLLELLDTGCTDAWEAPERFRELYYLIDVFSPDDDSERRHFLDRYRPGGAGPPVKLLPCPVSEGDSVVHPLPPRRKPGGQPADEEDRSMRVYHLGGTDRPGTAPPKELKLSFLDEVTTRTRSEATGERQRDSRLQRVVEDVLDVPPYETLQTLRRLHDVGIAQIQQEDARREVARFVFDFLLRRGQRSWDLVGIAAGCEENAPEQFFPGFPHEDHRPGVRAARRGLSQISFPEAQGTLRAARDLRFTARWHPRYGPLDMYNPLSVAPIDAVDEIVEYLDVDETLGPLSEEKRARLGETTETMGMPDGDRSATSRVLAWAFARLCGVWETAPVGYIFDRQRGARIEEVQERIPEQAELFGSIHGSHWNSFQKQDWYQHENTRVAITWWLRDMEHVLGDPQRARALVRLLARDWNTFFSRLNHSFLLCPGCKIRYEDKYKQHKGLRTSKPHESPPSALFAFLSEKAWYPLHNSSDEAPSDGGSRTPLDLWILDEPPGAERRAGSPYQFVPYVQERDEEKLRVLRDLGTPRFRRAPASHYLGLLDRLRTRFHEDEGFSDRVSEGRQKVAFIGLHRQILARIQDLMKERSGRPDFRFQSVRRLLDAEQFFEEDHGLVREEDWERLAEMPLLAERGEQLIYLPAGETLVDDGSDSFARNLFRSSAAFLCVDTDGQVLARLLGALLFDTEARPYREPEAEEDMTEALRDALEPFLPALGAIMARIVPGGGTPMSLEGEEFQRRLARLRSCRFIHCHDLVVEYAVKGRENPDGPREAIHPKAVGEGREGDAHYLEGSENLLLFDHPIEDRPAQDLLPRLAPHVARILGNESYEYIFTIVLGLHEPGKRRRFLEDRGITPEDLDSAARAMGAQDRRQWERMGQVWVALVESVEDGPKIPDLPTFPCFERTRGNQGPRKVFDDWKRRTEAVISDAAKSVREPLSAGLDALWEVALPGAFRRPENLGHLCRMERKGLDLSRFSQALEERGLEGIRIRRHAAAIRDLKRLHRETLVVALCRTGMGKTEAEKAVDGAFAPKDSWYHRATVQREELLYRLRTLLEAHTPRLPLPRPGASRETYRARVAQALDITPDRFETEVRQLFDREERECRLRRDFRAMKRQWRDLLVAIALPACDVRVDPIKKRAKEYDEAVQFPGIVPEQELQKPFRQWWRDEAAGVSEDIENRLMDSMRDGERSPKNTVDAIAAHLGREGLSRTVRRVERVLDKERAEKILKLSRAYDSYSDLQMPSENVHVPHAGETEPLEAGDQAGKGSMTSDFGGEEKGRDQKIKAGPKIEDAEERQRRGRLGEEGERVAFSWAMAPLVNVWENSTGEFRAIVKRLRNHLVNTWELDETLTRQFTQAAEKLTEDDLEREDVLESLQQICNLSGERASDAFGFDVLAWLPGDRLPNPDGDQETRPQIRWLEVKTSRSQNDSFHVSRNQYNTARVGGRQYVLLRVIKPSGKGPPTLHAFIDPVAQSGSGKGGGLRFIPERYQVEERRSDEE